MKQASPWQRSRMVQKGDGPPRNSVWWTVMQLTTPMIAVCVCYFQRGVLKILQPYVLYWCSLKLTLRRLCSLSKGYV